MRAGCRAWRACVGLLLGLACCASGATELTGPCATQVQGVCYAALTPPGSNGVMHYYSSRTPGIAGEGPSRALIVLHGHPRDARKTYQAAWQATQAAGLANDTLIVAPLFQVADPAAEKCRTAGEPPAMAGDLLWTCQSWQEGGLASNDRRLSAFSALDVLLAALRQQWPSLQQVTMAGFSAGAQMVQHYIAFAHPPAQWAMRYVVADPGTWLYFDPVRMAPAPADEPCGADNAQGCRYAMAAPATGCDAVNRWKYGLEGLPEHLQADAAQARSRYIEAQIYILEGALDSGTGQGTSYGILDKHCAANAQGPYRLQRGLAYAAYVQAVLRPTQAQPLVIVPGCAHDVACVFTAPAARGALFGTMRR